MCDDAVPAADLVGVVHRLHEAGVEELAAVELEAVREGLELKKGRVIDFG